MSFPRRPLTIVEIDVDRCTLTYGSAPCTAALSAFTPRKCFNTFRTCQDTVNYDRGSLTLRFGENIKGLPKNEGVIFPVLQSVSERPSEVNLSGLDARSTALGKRAKVDVALLDFSDPDFLTDKYRAERISGAAQFDAVGYDPAALGQFFSREFARSPYLFGRPLRVLRGEVGQALSSFEVSHYVIERWSGPNAAGQVSIVAKDPLNLVEGDRALAPSPSSGVLLNTITAGASSATLTPAGIGDAEYPASGRAAIGREVVRFTRSGDALTLIGRGEDGSTASQHEAGDTVQLCLRYENQRLDEVAFDLLTVQGPVDPTFVDQATWEAEVVGIIPGVFTRTLTAPTPISQLLGELCQHGAVMWWDGPAQKVGLRSNRPRYPSETLKRLTDGADFIEGSVDVRWEADRRISANIFRHALIDPTDAADQARNFARNSTVADPSSASANEYGAEAIAIISSPWLGSDGSDAVASVIAERLVSRYRDIPRVFSARVPLETDLDQADLIEVESFVLVDDIGAVVPVQMQVFRVVPFKDWIEIEAEDYPIVGRFGMIMDGDTDTEDYGSATDEEKLNGCYMVDEATTVLPDGTTPYQIF